MFGFGGHLPELIIILVAALVIFGPKRLPDIGSSLGKTLKEFRKSTATDPTEKKLADERTEVDKANTGV
jgi:sec-independent protein translocase protein TatA